MASPTIMAVVLMAAGSTGHLVDDSSQSTCASEEAVGGALLQHGSVLSQGPGVQGGAGGLRPKPASEACPLPLGARWCQVRVGGLDAFPLAVYAANDIVSNSLCSSGTWEINTLEPYGPAGSAVDIGANVGFYTLALAKAGWNVTAFEPLVSNIDLLRASLCRNPDAAARITLHTVGLGSRPQRCRMVSGRDNVGDGVVQCGSEEILGVFETRGDFDIRRLDDVLAEQRLGRIDFLKIDVEGFECEVFAGGSSVLSKYRPRIIQSEVWRDMQNCTPKEYLGKFLQSKYVVSKELSCEHEDMSIDASIQDFYMCRASKSSFLQEEAGPPTRGIVLMSAA